MLVVPFFSLSLSLPAKAISSQLNFKFGDCCWDRDKATHTEDSGNRGWRSSSFGVCSCLFDVSESSVEETKC